MKMRRYACARGKIWQSFHPLKAYIFTTLPPILLLRSLYLELEPKRTGPVYVESEAARLFLGSCADPWLGNGSRS